MYLFAVNLELINSLWVPNIFNKYKYIQTVKFLLSVNLELINSLWVPNIFIYNLKTFQVIDVLSKLAGPIKKLKMRIKLRNYNLNKCRFHKSCCLDGRNLDLLLTNCSGLWIDRNQRVYYR